MAKKPNIRFNGFTEEWQKQPLGKLGEFKSNGVDKKSNPEEHPVNLLNYLDVYNKRHVTADNCNELMQVTANDRQLKENDVKEGDVFFTPSSETPDDIGRVKVIEEDLPNTVYSYHLMRFRKSGDILHKIFPEYALETEEVRKQMFLAAQGAQRFVISKPAFEQIKMSFPKYAEQQKIGDFFKTLDELIGAKEEELEKLRQLKTALLEQMFPSEDNKHEVGGGNSQIISLIHDSELTVSTVPNTPRIRFKGFTEPWERKELGDIGYTFTGLSGKTKADFGHGKAKYVTYMNVFSNPIAKLTGYDIIEIDNRQNQVRYGDVLFTTSSETPEEVGMSSVWLGDEENVYLNSFCFGYRPNIEVYPYYLAFALRSPRIRKSFYRLAQGISRFNISKQKAMEIMLDLPELAEQQKIGDFFRDQDDAINAADQQIRKLKTIKRALMDKMFA